MLEKTLPLSLPFLKKVSGVIGVRLKHGSKGRMDNMTPGAHKKCSENLNG